MEINIAIGCMLLIAGIIEKIVHQKRLAKIPIRILVNGTRGKTSVTRLLYAVLKENGTKVIGKTTGSDAAILLPDGEEMAYRKPNRMVSIREHIPFLKRALQMNVEAMVVECMAIMPENQYIIGNEMIRPTITLMTNARVDHVAEIGATEEQTVETLSLSIAKNTMVISTDPRFGAYAKDFHLAKETPLQEDYFQAFSYPVFAENVQLVLACAKLLGIDQKTALVGMQKAVPDIGMRGPFFVSDQKRIINGFATNEPLSAKMLLESSRKSDTGTLYVLYNHRADREYRLKQFLPLIVELFQTGAKVFVMGEECQKASNYFKRKGRMIAQPAPKDLISWFETLPEEAWDIFAIGNIAGAGRELIENLQEVTACLPKPLD